MASVMLRRKLMRRYGCLVVAIVLATTAGCAAKVGRQGNARGPVATRVVFHATEPDSAGNAPSLKAPCPVDLTLRELTCPAQSALVELVFSTDGRVTRSRIARSSGFQVLDLGCMLASYSCVVGQSSQPAALECSVQCE
jgi:hypothetical protein